jgi:hypothetical protein
MKYGVLVGIHASSHHEARLLQEMLQREMRERASKPEEAKLAEWNNYLTKMRRDADKEGWGGWE